MKKKNPDKDVLNLTKQAFLKFFLDSMEYFSEEIEPKTYLRNHDIMRFIDMWVDENFTEIED